MSYSIIYTIPFASVNNTPMLLEVLKEGYEGKSTELIGGATPFTISIDEDDFLYTPLRLSTGKLKLVGSDYLQEIYSTDYQQYKVNLKRNDVIIWTGYIKPEVYTQDYSSVLFELEVECVSAMSTLEFIEYKREADTSVFISLLDVIKKCVVASKGDYGSIYIPHVYAPNKNIYAMAFDTISKMLVSEQNFFDEENKPMKLKEVLEEVCKYLNWTCTDWKGDLYFVDMDHTGQYMRFLPDFSNYYTESNINSKVVQNIGFSGSGHTFDRLGGYSKASVRVDNYKINNLLPVEDIEKCALFTKQEYQKDNEIYLYEYYTPLIYELYQYRFNSDKKLYDLMPNSEVTSDNIKTNCGASLIKRANYDNNNKPSKLDWETVVRFKKNSPESSTTFLPEWMMSYKKTLETAGYAKMGIVINFDIFFSNNPDGIALKDENLTASNPKIYLKLSLGNMCWNGSKWVNGSNTFLADLEGSGWLKLKNTNKFTNKYKSSEDGYYIELPSDYSTLGAFNLKIAYPTADYNDYKCFFIKNIKITGSEGEDNDRIYENIVNDQFVRELDEIDFKINSWNADPVSFSKVIFSGRFVTDNIYSVITDSGVRPEELLIKRIINQYKATKTKLTQILKYDESISPLTVMYDNIMVNKKFAITGGDIDYKNESFTVKMIEKK